MRKFIPYAVAIFVLLGIVYETYHATFGLRTSRHSFGSGMELSSPLKIAFISDLHLTNTAYAFERLDQIHSITRDFSPDLILFGGDFTGEHTQETTKLKSRMLTALALFTEIAPTYTVLGNHEWWTSPNWANWLSEIGFDVIEGQTRYIRATDAGFCLRGLGDAFTDHYRSTPFPANCQGLKITLTHDPVAIELDPEPGLYLAGHTHCGQIRLPFVHPSWAPTSASPEFVCGTGASSDRVWLTSSGVGTSVIPLRFGAPASIELITVN